MGTNMLNHVSRTALAASAAVLIGTGGAWAQDAEAFADRLVETSKLMGIAFSYGSAVAEGGNVIITDFTFAVPAEEPAEVPGEIVFEGVSETPDGGFTAQRATIADIEHTAEADELGEGEELTFTLVDIVAEGIVLPPAGAANAADVALTLFDRVSAGPMTLLDNQGTELFAVETFSMWMDDPDADGGYASGYAIEGIRADLSSVDDAELRPIIDAFDIEQFGASIIGEGVWWPDTGRLELSDNAIILDNLGTLRMSVAVDGYSRELYNELTKINVKMAELAESDEEVSEAEIAQMTEAATAIMAETELVNGSLRYEDNSLFMKLLDFIGAEQGVDGETFKAGLQFMVPMLLAEVQDQNFRTMVTSAVNAFVNDPQNFTISAQPDNPIPFTEFEDRAAEIEADPFILVEMLNLEITSND